MLETERETPAYGKVCAQDAWGRRDQLGSVVFFLVPRLCLTLLGPHGLYVAHQAPLCMGFPRQEYWSGLPCPSPGDLPNPGIKLGPPAWTSGFFTTERLGSPAKKNIIYLLLLYYYYYYLLNGKGEETSGVPRKF